MSLKNTNIMATSYPTIAVIKTGDGRKTADFLGSLKLLGRRVGDWTEKVMEQDDFKKSVSETSAEYELCTATVKELTGSDVATLRDILSAVIKKGYDKCQPEDGPRLREAYSGTDLYFLAMDPIRDSGGDPRIFCVYGSVSALWLDTSWHSLDLKGRGDRLVVFRRRKTS